MSKRRLLIISVVILLFIIALAAVAAGTRSSEQRQTAADDSETFVSDSDRKVYISGIDNLELDQSFGITDVSVVGQSVYGFLYAQLSDAKPSYQANVRDGSYKLTSDGSVTNGQFLVDVPDLQRTLRVEIEANDSVGSTSIYVFCPSESELVYKPISCQEVDH